MTFQIKLEVYLQLQTESNFDNIPDFVCIYGASGTGKTRLACAAMRSDPKRWGEKAIYVPFDGKRGLKSVLQVDRDKVVIADFTPDDKGKVDLYREMVALFTRDWKIELPGVRTIIIDPLTTFAKNLLAAIATAQVFSDKHIMIEGRGEGKLAYPILGDYGATQSAVMNILRFAEGCPYNVICICHETWKEPESGSPELMVGGPDTVGSAIINEVAGKFGSVIRLTNKDRKFAAHTVDKGIWKSKLRISRPNPIPEVALEEDPIGFWEKFNEVVT